MIELTFDTWEEFDKAIGSIVALETAIATPSEQRRVELTSHKFCAPSVTNPL